MESFYRYASFSKSVMTTSGLKFISKRSNIWNILNAKRRQGRNKFCRDFFRHFFIEIFAIEDLFSRFRISLQNFDSKINLMFLFSKKQALGHSPLTSNIIFLVFFSLWVILYKICFLYKGIVQVLAFKSICHYCRSCISMLFIGLNTPKGPTLTVPVFRLIPSLIFSLKTRSVVVFAFLNSTSSATFITVSGRHYCLPRIC